MDGGKSGVRIEWMHFGEAAAEPDQEGGGIGVCLCCTLVQNHVSFNWQGVIWFSMKVTEPLTDRRKPIGRSELFREY